MTIPMANVARCQAFVARVLGLSSGDRSTVVAAGVAAAACPIDPTYNWPSVSNCTAAGNINSAYEQAYRASGYPGGSEVVPGGIFVGTSGIAPDNRDQLQSAFWPGEAFFYRLASAASYATLAYETDPTMYTTLYSPFEGVIPFASL